MAYNTVIYSSAQAGMPATTLTTLGGMLAVLDAVLCDGMNSRTATAVTRSGSTATVTFTGTNNYAIGEVIENAGWDQPEYNGRFKVTARGAQTVSFTVAGTPTSPGMGTGQTIKHPAAGWTRTSLGTNITGYRTKAGSLGHYVQIEDTSTATCAVRLAEALTGLDTATSLGDKRTVTKAAGNWVVVADGRTCYCVMAASNVLHFGEFAAFNPADNYAVFSTRGDTGDTSGMNNGRNFPAGGYWPTASASYSALGATFLRGNSQLAGFVNGHVLNDGFITGAGTPSVSMSRAAPLTIPNQADNSIPVMPEFLLEYSTVTVLRGQLRGMYRPLGVLDASTFVGNVARLDDAIVSGAVRSLAVVRYGPSSGYQIAFDLGDWT